MKIYKNCISEPYSFFIIDTTLPANDLLRFRTNLLDFLLSDKFKILDNKFLTNQVQYNLDREAANVSALSFDW